MLRRTAFLFVLVSLILASVPLGTTGYNTPAYLNPQRRPVVLSTMRLKRSGGRTELKLTGRYERDDKVVELHGLTIKEARRRLAAKQKRNETFPKQRTRVSTGPIVSRFSTTEQDPMPVVGGRDPGYYYYYTEGDMTKSDGAVLVNSTYE